MHYACRWQVLMNVSKVDGKVDIELEASKLLLIGNYELKRLMS